MNHSWPLNINNFTEQDRSDIADFIKSPNNRWTQDKEVMNFEKLFADYVGSKYSVFVSSGSTANTILAQFIKDKYFKDQKIVVLPSTTWQTSCSPWIREGFIVKFIDISLSDFSFNFDKLEEFVSHNYNDIACIFPTSLIGYSPNIEAYQKLQKKYNVKIMFDNCENTLGQYNHKNLSSYFTSTTSTYFGHQIQSVEGGFIFTNSLEEYEYFLMLRNHGMNRGLLPYGLDNKKYKNDNVDALFDFYCLGNNYRNTDINAFIGQKDLTRATFYKNRRQYLYNIYQSLLDRNIYYLPSLNRSKEEDVPFCLPVIPKDKSIKEKAIDICKNNNIEYRPIISGFLGYQTCYKPYFTTDKDYPNSIFLHNNGFYVGLHPGLTEDQIITLVTMLNNI